MFSMRGISRSAVRSASRLAAQPTVRRNLSSIYRPSNSVWQKATSKSLTSLLRRTAFSTSPIVRDAQDGQVDGELSAKLQEEWNMEQEMGAVDTLPFHLQEFLDNSGFAVSETAGNEEVVLTKKFGQETVKVAFSIADLDAYDPEADAFGEDGALADEGMEGATGRKGSQEEAAVKAEEEEDVDEEPSFPARLDVTIEKPGAQGAVQFSGVAQDGQFVIENVFYFPTRELADAADAQADWSRRSLYTGPPYGNLDEDLQVLLERYLDERGINTALALWVPEYIDFKEQREYLSWLQSIKGFVDA